MLLLTQSRLPHSSLHSALQHHSLLCCRLAAAAASSTPSTRVPLHPVVYHPDFQISPLPNDHRFPMPKDHLLYEALQQEGLAVPPQPVAAAAVATVPTSNVFTPTYPDSNTLCLVHDMTYVNDFLSGSISAAAMRRIGLPWSQQLVQRTLIGTGSAVLAARLALSFGVAIMCNGGWCIFNDLAVAARAAQRDAGVQRVLILDLDVHQGDGSAAIFAGDPSVYTFSVHCKDQTFPTVVQQSDWDVPLPAGTTDEQYLEVLQQTLPTLFDKVQPDLCLYNAGVDVHKDDQLGLLALSNDGIAARDAMVLEACLAAGVPVAAAIGGGYQKDHAHIVTRHMHLHQNAAQRMLLFSDMMESKRVARGQRADASLVPAAGGL